MVQLNHPLVVKFRLILAEAGLGLIGSWWLLFLLEQMRAGAVSLYIDLNLVLVLGMIMFFIGQTDLKQPKFYTNLQLLISGIMIVWLAITLL